MTVSRVINKGSNVREVDARRGARSDRAARTIRRTPPRAASPPGKQRTSACSTPTRAPPISPVPDRRAPCGAKRGRPPRHRIVRIRRRGRAGGGHSPLRDQRRRRRDPAAAAIGIAADHGRARRDGNSGRHRRDGRAARRTASMSASTITPPPMEMTHYLLELGHRKIGFIKGHPNHVASHDRYRGFCDALDGSRARLPKRCRGRTGLFQLSFRPHRGRADCWRATNRPTAIFASNDDMAAATVSVAHRRGPRCSRGPQHRRLRRHRARDQRLARADDGQAADRRDGGGGARAADCGPSRSPAAADCAQVRPSACSATR